MTHGVTTCPGWDAINTIKTLGISNRLQGQKLAAPIANPLTGEVMFDEGKVLSREEAVQVETPA